MRRPPGRPRAPATSRAALLQVVALRVGRLGWAATTLRDVAADAGVSLGTVQHQFPTKDDLFRALVDEVLLPAYGAPPGEAPARSAAAWMQARLEASITRPGLSAAILFDRSEGWRARLDYLATRLRPQQESQLGAVRALMQAGQLQEVDPAHLAALLGVILPAVSSSGPALLALLDLDLEDPQVRRELAHTWTNVLLYGLLPRGPNDQG